MPERDRQQRFTQGPGAGPAGQPLYTTPGGHRRLCRRIEEARSAYASVCQSNEEAAGAGDSSVWHDNFAYEENQRQMHQLARRVRDLEGLLAGVAVVPLPTDAPETVRLGATVVVEPEPEGPEQRWFIAGYDDGNPALGRISYNSPLATALLGAQEGDRVAVRAARGRRFFEVVEILAPGTEDEAAQ